MSAPTEKWRLNVLAFTKRVSTAIALTLALSMPLAPAFSAPPSPTPPIQNQPPPPLGRANLVPLRSGGPLMTVFRIEGDQVNCGWTNWDGQIRSDNFPIDVLQKF